LASRLTFRDKAADIAWQKQLRDKYLEEGAPDIDLDLKTATVKRITRTLAKQIILKYEWLGTLPPSSLYYGLFFGEYCAGVVCYVLGSVGANVNAHSEFGIDRDEMIYLVRGANVHWSPKGANSKLVSISLNLIGKTTGAKLAIAYSDTDAGEIGTIYQACNWTYVGKTGAPGQIVAPNGRIYDIRNVSSWAKQRKVSWQFMRDALVKNGWFEQPTNPKHKYVYVIDKSDKRLTKLVEEMRQPYPKRGRGETDSAFQSNEETGGASPTRPLESLQS